MIDRDMGCLEIQEPFLSCEYEGNRDKDDRKSGLGIHIWTSSKVKQKYEGDFFQNTLHGFGDLLVEKQFNYTGHFFANCYEGYGRIKYFDGNIFEGLFKDNERFGPGVFTYPFGAQDVGFWIGGSLIRLCCNYYLDLIPKITRSNDGKKYIKKFKTLITFQYPPLDKAKEILTRELNVDENDSVIIKKKDELYNRFLGQENSVAFNGNKFEEVFFSSQGCESIKSIYLNSEDLLDEELWEEYCPVKSLTIKETLLQEIKDQIGVVDVLVYYLQLQKKNIDQESVQQSYESHEEDEYEYIDDYGVYRDYDEKYTLKILEEEYPWLKGSLENVEVTLQGNGLVTFQKKHFELFERDSPEDFQRIQRLFLLMEQLKDDLTNKYEEVATKRNIRRRRTGSANNGNENIVEIQSWNNNQWITEMVTYCYQYKQKEDTLSFNISDFDNRLNFSVCGPHEGDCLCFLLQCAFGNTIDIINLCKRNININVSSCEGNSGVFFAVAFDNVKVLKTLVELGADLDIYNDECLTPLTISICRLLALLYNVNDWEKAFLSTNTGTALKQQETMKDQRFQIDNSKLILPPSVQVKINKQIFDCKSVDHQEFILSLENPTVSSGKRKGIEKKGTKKDKNKKEKRNKKEKKKSSTSEKKEEIETLEDTGKNTKVEQIKETILTLIDLGANPDIGTVPLPPLILSIFSKCKILIKKLINRGNPNITTFIDNLSAVHVLCCLPFHEENLEVFRIFVSATNLDLRTNTDHWKREKELILSAGPFNTVLDQGKTALHILCMRNDFEGFESIQCKMLELLVNEGADLDSTYLGHTPLTLAMLRGNVFLVEEMMKCRFVNLNQILGEGMGVPLTMLLLKRYKGYLPVNVCMRFVGLLINYNANPFIKFSIYGNAVEFLEKEYESSVTKTKDLKRSKSKSKQTKGKDKKKKSDYKVLINHFLACSRNFLLRHIQAKVCEYLYFFISEACSEEKYLFYLAKFVNIDEAVQCLQLLIQNRIIVPDENTLNTCKDVLNFVRASQADSARRASKSSASLTLQSHNEMMLTNFNIQKNIYIDEKYNCYPPELDRKNLDKYLACYHCCKSVGKELIPCPNCWIVYFCSEICNKSSLQAGAKHKCKLLFYATEKARLKSNEILASSIYYTPLQAKFDLIKEQIRKRKYNKMLEERFAKEWNTIHGCRPKNCDKLEFKNAKIKFIRDKLCAFYRNDTDAPTGCVYKNTNML